MKRRHHAGERPAGKKDAGEPEDALVPEDAGGGIDRKEAPGGLQPFCGRRANEQQPGNTGHEAAGNDAQQQGQHDGVQKRRPCQCHEQPKACQAEGHQWRQNGKQVVAGPMQHAFAGRQRRVDAAAAGNAVKQPFRSETDQHQRQEKQEHAERAVAVDLGRNGAGGAHEFGGNLRDGLPDIAQMLADPVAPGAERLRGHVRSWFCSRRGGRGCALVQQGPDFRIVEQLDQLIDLLLG